MAARLRVVMTGAAGLIGRAVSPALAARWDLVRTDLSAGDGVEALDVTNLSACRAAFEGADAVVHLAAVPDPAASWEQLLAPNVVGAYAVAQAAMDVSVPRLVLASSLQAVSAYPTTTQSRAEDPPFPANLYGATKAWTEALGGWVAHSSDTTVVALRIGNFQLESPNPTTTSARDRAAWLSPGDAARLIERAVEVGGFGFAVVNGVSANRYRQADLTTTERLIGYRPLDDAWPATGG